MLYYKHAETVAAPDDYFNLGYINMRMGALYRDYYSMDGKETEKYEQALVCLGHTDNKLYELKCLISLGCLHRIKSPDRADTIFHKAMALAMEIDDTTNYVLAATNLAQLYYYYKQHSQARSIIQSLLKKKVKCYPAHYYPTAASVYACLGMVDSAELFLEQGQETYHFTNILDKMAYMESVGMIALARGDTGTYLQLEAQCRHMSDSLHALEGSMKIIQAETSFDQLVLDKSRHESHTFKLTLIALAAVVAVTIMFLSLLHRTKRQRIDRLIMELKQESESQLTKMKELQQSIKDQNLLNDNIREFINSQIVLIRQVADECYHNPKNKLSKSIINLVKYSSKDSEKWLPLYDFIDSEHKNIMKHTREKFPQLNDKETLLIALTVLDFSCAQIAIVFGFDQATSVGAARNRLAKKMNIDSSLSGYVEKFN